MGGMVTIFDPQGNKGEIPFENLAAAVKAGAKPAITMKAPDGSLGDIPADQMPAAVKAGASIVPLKDQENQHPGFWHTLWSDLSNIKPSGVSPYPGMDQEAKSAAATQAAQQDQSRQAAGYSAPYRALAPVAQAVGVNVPGMEQSAAQGDQAGVLGHAAAAAAPVAAAEILHQGGAVVPEQLRTAAGAAATSIPPAVTAALKKLPVSMVQRIPYLGDVLTDVYKAGSQAYQEAKAPSIATPSAIGPTTPAAEVLPLRAPRGAAAAAQNFKAIKQAQALRDVTQNVVDQAIPPNGGNLGLNKRVQEQVNSHLAQGDVAAAESVLDEAAKSVNPKWDPNRPKIVPSVQNIRENLKQVRDAESGPTRVTPDSMDDHALQQEMNWDLEKHGYRAESEARREFIARNSTGITKGDLTAAAQKSAGTPAAEDLTPEWRAALDDLRKKAKK